MQSFGRAAAIAITSAASLGIAACDNFKSDKERIAKEYGTTPEAVDKVMEDARRRAEQPATDPTRVAARAPGKPTPASIPDYGIEAYCSRVAEAVGGSYVIEKSCRDQEQSSEAAIHARTIPHRVLKYCDQVSRAIGGSYAIFGTCADQEIRAAADLQLSKFTELGLVAGVPSLMPLGLKRFVAIALFTRWDSAFQGVSLKLSDFLQTGYVRNGARPHGPKAAVPS